MNQSMFFLIFLVTFINCKENRNKMIGKSDWKKANLIEAFEKNAYDIGVLESITFDAEKKIDVPYEKYTLSNQDIQMYLIAIEFETSMDAINKSTQIANDFRRSTDNFISSGVNGNILCMIISSEKQKEFNLEAFSVLKNI